jgi:hypothetical protein
MSEKEGGGYSRFAGFYKIEKRILQMASLEFEREPAESGVAKLKNQSRMAARQWPLPYPQLAATGESTLFAAISS